MKRWIGTLLLIGAMTGTVWAQDEAATADVTADAATEEDGAVTEEQQLALAKMVAPSLVVVEYTLKYDKGETPVAYGANLSRLSQYILQERPFEVTGFLLDDSTVMTSDLVIHPRFIKSISVRLGDARVDATPSAYATTEAAMFLTLSDTLDGGTPLVFDVDSEETLQLVRHSIDDGEWAVHVQGGAESISLTEDGEAYGKSTENILAVDITGKALGVSMNNRMPAGDAWRGSPLEWDQISADNLADKLDAIDTLSGQSLVQVELSFRSPRKRSGFRASSGDTKLNVTGVLLENQRVLILEDMRWYATRYLEGIKVFPGDDADPVAATFEGSLIDYGACVATLETPLAGALHLSEADIRDVRMDLLLMADVDIRDDNRVTYFAHNRIVGYYRAWENQRYPFIHGDEETVYMFNTDSELVALPIARRTKTSVSMNSQSPRTTGTDLLAFLNDADLSNYFDEYNTPLNEDEEYRVAWMGLKLQPLDEALARDYGVSELTRDGETGAIVSFIYPDSPAAEAGVEEEWILLRLHVEDEPRPMEVRASSWVFETQTFPWDSFDAIPDDQFENIPPPWAPIDMNELAFQLTDLGYGTFYEAEFFVDGEIVTKELEVVESPMHHETAPRYENETLGLTVRDMTFEVAEFLRRDLADGGVIVSKTVPGEEASVKGIKPYEVILEVNGQPVKDIEHFEQLITDQPVLDVTVLRWKDSRSLKIRMPVDVEEELDDLDDMDDIDLDDMDDVDIEDEMDDLMDLDDIEEMDEPEEELEDSDSDDEPAGLV